MPLGEGGAEEDKNAVAVGDGLHRRLHPVKVMSMAAMTEVEARRANWPVGAKPKDAKGARVPSD